MIKYIVLVQNQDGTFKCVLKKRTFSTSEEAKIAIADAVLEDRRNVDWLYSYRLIPIEGE